eukprot:Skav233466  [mRNA]  locus=scaffold1080:300345:300951:- [translate_table: standard]
MEISGDGETTGHGPWRKPSEDYRPFMEERYVSVVDDAALQADISGALSTLLEDGDRREPRNSKLSDSKESLSHRSLEKSHEVPVL